VRFDVQHHGLQAGRFGQALAVLHAVLAAGGDQHFHVAGGSGAGADDAKVQAHFIQRERDVLVGLGLDLQFHLFFAQARRQHDLLGDDGRLRHGHHDLLGLGAALAEHPFHGGRDFVEFLDLAVGDPALFKGLGRKAFEHVFAARGLIEFHQLHAGRTDVQPDHGRVFATQQCVQKTQVSYSPATRTIGKNARQQPRAC
jgi:hypothetical protein